MKVVVLGGGVAAELFLFFATRVFPAEIEFTQIYDEDFAPPCSLNSTAVASLRGTSRHVGELGDLIVDGMEFLLDFVQTHKPLGCQLAPHYQVWSENDERKERRFFGVHTANELHDLKINLGRQCFISREQAIIFTPGVFLEWLRNNRARKVEILKAPIRGVAPLESGQIRVDLLGKPSVYFNSLTNCLGHGAKIWESFFPQDKMISKTKIVSGSYLEWSGINDWEQSFSLTFNETNLIYRREVKSLQLGAVNSESAHFLCLHQDQFREHYNEISAFLSIPAMSHSALHTGVRHKGQKRTPFWGKVTGYPEHQVWALYGLYKNAFTAGPRLAHQLALEMSQQL